MIRKLLAGVLMAVLAMNARAENKYPDGFPAPEIGAGAWMNGGSTSLAQLTDKYVILEFWATWCGPCMSAMPHVNQLHAKYKDKGVVVIGLTDEPLSRIQGTVKARGWNFLIGAQATCFPQYGIDSIPRSIIIRPGGKIVFIGHPSELEGQLEALIEKYGPAGAPRATQVAAPAPTIPTPGRAELAEPVAEAAPQAQPTLLSIPSTAIVSAAGVSSDDTSNASPEKLLRLAEQQMSYGMTDKAIEYYQRAAGSNEESASKQMALQKLVQFENEASQKLTGAQGKAPLDACMVCIEVMMTYRGTSAAKNARAMANQLRTQYPQETRQIHQSMFKE